MGMGGYTTGSLRRLPKFLGLQVRTGTIRISTSQIEAVLDEVQKVTQEARRLVAGRNLAHLTTNLEPTSWSVAQCLDHLALTTIAVLPAISAAIARAPRLTVNRKLKTGALTRLFLRKLEPPYRWRMSVHSALAPGQRDFNFVWEAFEETQAQLATTIRGAIGLAIDQVIVESPVYSRLKYNVYGALRMIAAHERRHLCQMERILKRLDDASHRTS
jgi:hypothetical protein